MFWRFDVLVLFAAIIVMILVTNDIGPEEIKQWIFFQWGKLKKWRAKKQPL